MKIRFEGLLVQDLLQVGHSPVQHILVRLVVSNAEMVTEPTVYPGNVAQFPDIYEFGIDDVAFVAELLNLEIEVVNIDNPSSEILIGKSNGNLRHLIPHFNQETQIVLPLALRDNSYRGEIHLKAIVTEMESALVELKQKYFEEEQLRVAYNDLVTATKSLEAEMEENMTKAQAQVDKVSKKYNALVEKYNELQDKFVNMSVEQERIQMELMNERAEKETLQAVTTETIAKFNVLNEELTVRVSDLTLENENINQLYFKATQDALDAKQELEALYQSKYETEMQLNDRISELLEELEALRASSVDVKVVEEMQAKVAQLVAEVSRLKMLSVNNSVQCTAQFINNTYVENIINNINVTNLHITNVLQSGDIEMVKGEFISLLRRYDDVKEAESRLLDRIFALLHGIRIFARTRPPSELEREAGTLVVESTGELPLLNLYDESRDDWCSFRLDGHWAYDGAQGDIFRDAEPLIQALVPDPLQLLDSPQTATELRSTAALVLGGAGSGRTFTLFGFGEQVGLAYRALQFLFSQLDHRSNQLLKEKQRRGAKHNDSDSSDPINDAVFEPTVTFWLCEVQGNSVYDALSDREISAAEVQPTFVDVDAAVSISGVQQAILPNVNDALQLLHSAVGRLLKSKQNQNQATVSATYIVGEIRVSIKYHKEEAPVTSRFLFGDIPLDASNVAACNSSEDANAHQLVTVLRGLGDGEEALGKRCNDSLVTRFLRGVLSPRTKCALFFTFNPSSAHVTVTRANAELAGSLMQLRRDVRTVGEAAADPVAMRAAKRKAKKLAHELREERQRTVQIEAKLIETKTVAEEYIVQFNERNKAISKHYEDEKRINQQLQSDLALTLRNLRKAVDELSEQRKVNEKLAALCKLLERERLMLANNQSTA